MGIIDFWFDSRFGEVAFLKRIGCRAIEMDNHVNISHIHIRVFTHTCAHAHTDAHMHKHVHIHRGGDGFCRKFRHFKTNQHIKRLSYCLQEIKKTPRETVNEMFSIQ